MCKRILSSILLIAVVLHCMALMPITTAADTEEGYTYTVSNGAAKITSGPKSGHIVIPSTLGGYPVRTIGQFAFENCTDLTGVTLPSTLTLVDYKAFIGCSNLMEIVIPDSVTKIGDYAFFGCESLVSVTFGENVERINMYSFYGCTNLTSVIIRGKKIVSINLYAFYNCDNIWHVLFSGTEDEWNAFRENASINMGNSSLTSATRHYNCEGDEILDPVDKTCKICHCPHSYDDDRDPDCNDCGEIREIPLMGDVDGDGNITSTDARLTLQYYVGKIDEWDLDLTVANVDSDGEITSTDARLILQYYVGKIEDFPAN